MKFKNNFLMLIASLVILVAICGYFEFVTSPVETFSLTSKNKTVVIDPGHGGFDPGKVGASGIYEKDINLKIALELKNYLEEAGVRVVMTRTEDHAAGGNGEKTTKNQDMRYRKEVINNSGADLMISIHQNAFTQPKVHGAQVFFYKDAQESKILATEIARAIKKEVDPENNRPIKNTTNYYVLKVSTMPGVIVECGFLTNVEEEKKLTSESYQKQMAWAIYKGINNYFENNNK